MDNIDPLHQKLKILINEIRVSTNARSVMKDGQNEPLLLVPQPQRVNIFNTKTLMKCKMGMQHFSKSAHSNPTPKVPTPLSIKIFSNQDVHKMQINIQFSSNCTHLNTFIKILCEDGYIWYISHKGLTFGTIMKLIKCEINFRLSLNFTPSKYFH